MPAPLAALPRRHSCPAPLLHLTIVLTRTTLLPTLLCVNDQVDLHHFADLLDAMDDHLDRISSGLLGDNVAELKPVDPAERGLLLEILRFTTLFIENCTNKQLYNSVDVSLRAPPPSLLLYSSSSLSS